MLESTKDDRVFVYFADHGGVGLVSMPSGHPVYAQDLMDTLRYMWSNGMYKELVFYMEACESGSMFEGLLPSDVSIYATTAANSKESSYGTYCNSESSVNGTVCILDFKYRMIPPHTTAVHLSGLSLSYTFTHPAKDSKKKHM